MNQVFWSKSLNCHVNSCSSKSENMGSIRCGIAAEGNACQSLPQSYTDTNYTGPASFPCSHRQLWQLCSVRVKIQALPLFPTCISLKHSSSITGSKVRINSFLHWNQNSFSRHCSSSNSRLHLQCKDTAWVYMAAFKNSCRGATEVCIFPSYINMQKVKQHTHFLTSKKH